MKQLGSEEDEGVKHKLVGALSSLSSDNPEVESFFVQMKGVTLLSKLLKDAKSPAARAKIVFFLTRLAQSQVRRLSFVLCFIFCVCVIKINILLARREASSD